MADKQLGDSRNISPFALCPYYRAEQGERIICSAVGAVESVFVCCYTKRDRKKYQEKYCNSFEYGKCFLAEALNKKWEQNEHK